MDKQFLTELQNYGFTDSQISELSQAITPIELPTRHILVNQGAKPDSVYFLLDGLCHACYLTQDGKQFSKEFYWENDWILGFESLINDQRSPYLLESLTPVKMISIPLETVVEWRECANPLYIKLLETQLVYKEAKERFMLLYSAEEKYDLFCQNYPDLESRLNDYQIAAYLGISHVSLSRIKSRLKSK